MICISMSVSAAVKRADSVKEFDREVKKSKLAIAMLYVENRETRKDKELRNKLKGLHKDFRSAGKQEQEVRFISANLDREALAELKDRYKLSDMSRPIFILFKDGSLQPFKDESGKAAIMAGFPSAQQLSNFISDMFQDYIDEIIRDEIRKARNDEDRRARGWYYGPRFYTGWGYPYYYYPYRSWGWGFYW